MNSLQNINPRQVKKYKRKRRRKALERAEGINRKIFVGGLPAEATSQDIVRYFSQFGEIENARLIGEVKQKPRGYGFVTFACEKVLNTVLNMEHSLGGRVIDVNHTNVNDKGPSSKDPNSADNLNRKVYAAGLPLDSNKQEVCEHFSRFGEVTNVLFFMRKEKESAFAFVTFAEPSSRDVALSQPQQQFLDSDVSILIREAVPRQKNLSMQTTEFGSSGDLSSMPEANLTAQGSSPKPPQQLIDRFKTSLEFLSNSSKEKENEVKRRRADTGFSFASNDSPLPKTREAVRIAKKKEADQAFSVRNPDYINLHFTARPISQVNRMLFNTCYSTDSTTSRRQLQAKQQACYSFAPMF